MNAGRRFPHRAVDAAVDVAVDVVPLDDGSAAFTGPVAELAALIDHLHRSGAVITASPAGQPDRLHVSLPPSPTTSSTTPAAGHTGRGDWLNAAPARRWGKARITLTAIAVLLVLAGLGLVAFGVYLAVLWVAAHAAAIAAAGIALAVLGVLAGPGACTTTVRITHRH